MSKEIELKMVVMPAALKSVLPVLLNRLGAQEVKETWLVNAYFDTSELLLNQARIALRVRQKEGLFIQTLKTKGYSAGGLSQRGEWEWVVPENKLDVSLLHEGLWPSDIPVEELDAVFETNFKRISAIIECSGAKIELAVDEGCISSDEAKVPLAEIELELMQGDVDVLFEVASIIAKTMPVMLADVSKAEKGYRLKDNSLSNEFLYSYECVSDHKAYVKNLVSRNLAYWLYLVDRASVEFSRSLLADMAGVLCVLREVVSNYKYADSSKAFVSAGLFDSEIEYLNDLLAGDVMAGGVDQLLAQTRAGVLAIDLSRWLRSI